MWLTVNGETRQKSNTRPDDLRRAVPRELPEPVHDPAARRRHQHRHAPGRRPRLQPADLPEGGRRGGARHRGARAQRQRVVGPDDGPRRMRAFVVTGPRECGVQEVDPPGRRARGRSSSTWNASASAAPTSSSSPARWRTCTTGHAEYPMRLGHEWCGTVRRSATGVDRVLDRARAVTGDTMLGCGHCRRCRRRSPARVRRTGAEIGIRGGFRPARWPSSSPCRSRRCTCCPTRSTTLAGALVEPGGNALRAVRGAAV